MLRTLAVCALSLAACQHDAPSLTLEVDQGSLLIILNRAPDHTFGRVSGSLNGVDLGPADITAGQPSPATDAAASPARASFRIPVAGLAAQLHLEVREDADLFVLDAPSFGAARSLQVLTPLDRPLVAGDWIELSSGVPDDRLSGGFEITVGGDSCTVQWGTEKTARGVRYQLASNLPSAWWCGTAPQSGTLVQATLSLSLDPIPNVTCTGPSLTCQATPLSRLSTDLPVTVAF
jgi:hypothetical protein